MKHWVGRILHHINKCSLEWLSLCCQRWKDTHCNTNPSTPRAGAGAENEQRSQGAIRARRAEQPGKALNMYRRLPAFGTEAYKRAEAHWKRNIHYTHNFFCACPDWKGHFKWPGSADATGSAGGTGATRAVPGPLDGSSITGRGLTDDDIQETVGAVVHFTVDDSE
nr:MAG: ORF2 [Giant panda anellovirus]